MDGEFTEISRVVVYSTRCRALRLALPLIQGIILSIFNVASSGRMLYLQPLNVELICIPRIKMSSYRCYRLLK